MNRIKRLLVIILMVSMVQFMAYSLSTVQAANGESKNTPSVTAYATKDELMNVFLQDGTNTTIGKIVFGKDYGSNSLEWYILGKDSGVIGDNISIFAATPITTDQVFILNPYEREYSYDEGNKVVYPNHYGASDLRVLLRNMATGSSCFTSAEKTLLQATKVTTKDVKNSKEYTTTDVLYALYGDLEDRNNLKAGRDNDKVLPMSIYWGSGDRFWLRSPNENYTNYALTGNSGGTVSGDEVNDKHEVRPASNLNLSSVIFASAATTATADTVITGTIAEGKAMNLKLDGSNTEIGSVIYDGTQGIILAKKSASATGTVALVVQGNDGEDDWYYSKVIEDKEFVNVSDIKTAVGLSSDVDLTNCNIWMETAMNGLAYATEAVEGTFISSVAIDIDAPTPKTALDNKAVITTTGFSTNTPEVIWKVEGDTVTGGAEYNTTYTANLTLDVVDNMYIVPGITATVNGNEAIVTSNRDGTIVVSYTFHVTEMGTIAYTSIGYEGDYDGKSHGITVSVTEPEDAKISYSMDAGDSKNYSAKNPVFTNVGEDIVYYKIEKDNYTIEEGSKIVKINKKDITIKSADQTIISGDSIDTTKYTVTGLLEVHSINAVTLTPSTSEVTDDGIIEVSIDKIVDESGNDVTANYDVLCIPGKLVIEKEKDENFVYEITDGINIEWKTDEEGNITITGNGDYKDFIGVKVNGEFIDSDNYTVKIGSTIITLKNSYLKTLEEGTHTFEMVWKGGLASTSFTVKKVDDLDEKEDAPTEDDDAEDDEKEDVPTEDDDAEGDEKVEAPDTGDNNDIKLWFILLVVGVISLISLYRKKSIV